MNTQVGYAGGAVPRPTYELVCGHGSGHAEVVEVEYDPVRIAYEKLLEVFWSSHDPTTPRADPGSQYRSVIFYHTPEQERLARRSKDQLETSRGRRRPIATQILPAPTFWRAEEYHQRYYEKMGIADCPTR